MEEFITFLSENLIYILVALFAIFVLLGITLANYAFDSYVNGFEKMKKVGTTFGGNALDLANIISAKNFKGIVKTEVRANEEIKSNGSYSPSQFKVVLSNEIAYESNVGALAIVAHEFGHATQHFKNSKILVNNYKLSQFVKNLGLLIYPIFFLAIYFLFTEKITYSLICLGLILIAFFVALILKYTTIKLEKDASNIALKILTDLDILSPKEILLAKKFLNLAKRTYSAEFFRALFAWTGLTRKTKIF